MGLDLVELVMEIEDRFGVKLPDAECQRVRTVADLAGVVIERLPPTEAACRTAVAFYELRRSMIDDAGIERQRIRPKSSLASLFPTGFRRQWGRLRKKNRRIPALEPVPIVGAVLQRTALLLFFVWLLASAAAWALYGAAIAVLLSLLALGVGAWLSFAVARLFANRLPAGMQTVGDVVRVVAPVEVGHGSPGARLLAQQWVLEEVRRITSEQLSIPLEKVKPESDFVKDLGAD